MSTEVRVGSRGCLLHGHEWRSVVIVQVRTRSSREQWSVSIERVGLNTVCDGRGWPLSFTMQEPYVSMSRLIRFTLFYGFL